MHNGCTGLTWRWHSWKWAEVERVASSSWPGQPLESDVSDMLPRLLNRRRRARPRWKPSVVDASGWMTFFRCLWGEFPLLTLQARAFSVSGVPSVYVSSLNPTVQLAPRQHGPTPAEQLAWFSFFFFFWIQLLHLLIKWAKTSLVSSNLRNSRCKRKLNFPRVYLLHEGWILERSALDSR